MIESTSVKVKYKETERQRARELPGVRSNMHKEKCRINERQVRMRRREKHRHIHGCDFSAWFRLRVRIENKEMKFSPLHHRVHFADQLGHGARGQVQD